MHSVLKVQVMNIKRGRGRPAGASQEILCPHKKKDCFGPLGFQERSELLLTPLLQYPELHIIASLIDRKLTNALSYIGMTEGSVVDVRTSQCPYGLSCVSPCLAAETLLGIEELLIKAESTVLLNYGRWMTEGESPLYHLSAMVKVFGYDREGVRILGDSRARRRKAIMNYQITDGR